MMAKCYKCGFVTKVPFKYKNNFKRCYRCKGSLKLIYTTEGERRMEARYLKDKYDTKGERDSKKEQLLKIAEEKGFVNRNDFLKFFKNDFTINKVVKELISDGKLEDKGKFNILYYPGRWSK